MRCVKNIYVLKYIFVVKNICWVKLALWDTSFFHNSRVTVSLTMLIRLFHESLDVRSFSTESESRSLCTAAARQLWGSRANLQACHKVVSQKLWTILATRNDYRATLRMPYDVCEFIVIFVRNFQIISLLSFPWVLTYILGTQKKRFMKNALSIHNIHVCRFGCLALKTVYLSTKNTFRLEKKKLIDNALIYRPLKREQKKTQLLPIYQNLNQSEVLKTAQFWFSLLIDLSLHDIPFCMAWSARQGIFAIRN